MSRQSHNTDVRLTGNLPWPESSRYFHPKIMDASTATRLIGDDSKFNEPATVAAPLHYIDVTGDGVLSASTNPRNQESPAALKLPATQPNSTRILFINQRRRYSYHSTYVEFKTTQSEWLEILDTYMIPPPVVELLYDNNGGSLQHMSYCNDNTKVLCTTVFPDSAVCAYHICFKLCVWHSEHFVYARYDFHTRTTFIMVAGSSTEEQWRKVVTKLQDQRNAGLFDILLTLACLWAQEVEEHRWQVDFVTQTYESQTGTAALQYPATIRLPVQKLRLRTEMVSTQDILRVVARASEHTGELFQFLQNSLWRFHDACAEHTGIQAPKRYYQQLFDSLDMRLSQQRSQAAQIGNLKVRITAQWDVVNAILSHNNNDLTVDMARDSRADSVLMRRIAFVTMIFLPATFLATFFSMCFFDVNDSGVDLRVSRWIWLYVVCTMPFTLLLAWQYGPSSRFLGRVLNSETKKNGVQREKEEQP